MTIEELKQQVDQIVDQYTADISAAAEKVEQAMMGLDPTVDALKAAGYEDIVTAVFQSAIMRMQKEWGA